VKPRTVSQVNRRVAREVCVALLIVVAIPRITYMLAEALLSKAPRIEIESKDFVFDLPEK
jgi:hypothetical protein